jgi:hypothetical protein
MALLAVLVIVWMLASVPDFPGQAKGQRTPVSRVVRIPGVLPVVVVTLLYVMAHNVLYTYIASFLAPVGLEDRVSAVLLVFGVAVGELRAGEIVAGHGLDQGHGPVDPSSSSWTGAGATAAGSRTSSGHGRPCRAITFPRTRSRPTRSRPCHAYRATATFDARSRAWHSSTYGFAATGPFGRR